MRKSILFSLLLLAGAVSAKDYVVKSPDGRIAVTVAVTDKTAYPIAHDGNQVLAPSPMAMRFDNGTVIGEGFDTYQYYEGNDVLRSWSDS